MSAEVERMVREGLRQAGQTDQQQAAAHQRAMQEHILQMRLTHTNLFGMVLASALSNPNVNPKDDDMAALAKRVHDAVQVVMLMTGLAREG